MIKTISKNNKKKIKKENIKSKKKNNPIKFVNINLKIFKITITT